MEANKEIVKKYIVRVVCQNKNRFIPFKEEELDTKKFPEKSEQTCKQYAMATIFHFAFCFSCECFWSQIWRGCFFRSDFNG